MSSDGGAEAEPARQIADLIQADIAAGHLLPGHPIPSESAITQRFGVPRATAQAAVAILREQDAVYTVSGRGSYVTGVVVHDTVNIPAGATITARHPTEDERRAGLDAPVLVVTTDSGHAEYRTDEVELHTT